MTLTLLALFAALAVLGAILWLWTRRRSGSAEPERGPIDEPAAAATPLMASMDAPPLSTPDRPTAPEEENEDAAREVGADFYDEVVLLLESELAASPQRGDLRIKLLEMYAATHRKAEFLDLAQRHRKTAGAQDPQWARIAETGRQLLPQETLFSDADAGSDAPAPAPQPTRKFRRYYESVDAAQLAALETELHGAFQDLRQAASFWKDLRALHAEFAPPREPIQHVSRLSDFVGGAQIYVRHETSRPAGDAIALAAVGQVLLAKSLGRQQVIAAPADEGHALCVARAAAKLGLGAQILLTQNEHYLRAAELEALTAAGASVHVVADSATTGRMESQRAALAQALQLGGEALFVSPLEAGPFPYPVIVQELQGLAGRDLKSQISALTGRGPNGVIVSTADGMGAIGVLQAFLSSKDTKLYCVESATTPDAGAPRVEREHAWLRASGRVRYSAVPAEVARFAARHCMPDEIGELGLCGGEVLVETFTLARQFSPDEVVAVIVPSDAAPIGADAG